MTGRHGKRATRESGRSKLGVLYRTDAAASARRTKRAEVRPVRPPMREHSVPAGTRVSRSPRLPRGERDGSEDVAPAPRPPMCDWDPVDRTLPRAEAPAPPPPRTAYALRNRNVPDTSNRKPYIAAGSEKRGELKHGRPCSSRKNLEQHELWEAPSCARVGLEYYNSMNQGDEHELVKAVDVHSFLWCGMWLHANFLARPKGASHCFDFVPKCFFAELKLDGLGLHCASCVMIHSAESEKLGACAMCPSKILHPADGVHHGGQNYHQPADADDGGQTCFEPADDDDLLSF